MIKIMVDSASDCRDPHVYDIFIPLSVTFGDMEYHDGIDLKSDRFYEMLTSCEEFPHTSQPSPEDFIKYFEQAKEQGDELIYFALSMNLSGTYQSAVIAKSMVEYDGIYIIDTATASHMIGLLAKYAKRLIADGMSAKDIVARCEDVKARIVLYAGLDTLEYLKRGGRIGKASAFIGTLANIKPIITLSDGAVDTADKALGVAKAIHSIVSKVKKDKIDPDFPISILYTYGEDNCKNLEEKLTAEGYTVAEHLQIGPTIGTHVGPGVYGVFYVKST